MDEKETRERVVELLRASDDAKEIEKLTRWVTLALILKTPENTGHMIGSPDLSEQDVQWILDKVKDSGGRPIGFIGWGLEQITPEAAIAVAAVRHIVHIDDATVSAEWENGFKIGALMTFEIAMNNIAAPAEMRALRLERGGQRDS